MPTEVLSSLNTKSYAMNTSTSEYSVTDHTNWETNVELPKRPDPEQLSTHRMSIALLVLFLIIGGIMLNSITILMFVKNRLTRSPTNILVLNLATCDVMTSLGPLVLLLATLVHGSWIGGAAGCYAYIFMFVLFGIANLNTLAAMSVERWVIYFVFWYIN